MKMNRTLTMLFGLFCIAAALVAAEQKSIKDPPSEEITLTPSIPNRPPGKTAEVNGIKMYYEVFGKGEPLLLIHGGSASIESWFAQLPELAKKYQVIAADTRGHGRTPDSDKPLSYELIASDYKALLKHLNITNVSIVGWSDGGIVGLHLAMNNPELIKKLVAIGANFRANGMTEEIRAGLKASSPNDHSSFLVDAYKQLSPDGPEHWPVIYGKLKEMWLTQPNYMESDLKKIKCPTLVMAGDQDIVRPEHSVRLFKSIAKAQLCIIPGGSHYVPVEKPDLVNKILVDFLTN